MDQIDQKYFALAFLAGAATLVVYLGAVRFYKQFMKGVFREEPAVEAGEALLFPVSGSVALFSFYVALRFIPRAYVGALVSFYIGTASIFALAQFMRSYARPNVLIGSACVAVGVAHLYTRHWVLNNVLGVAVAVTALEMIPLDNFATSGLVLVGLFFYDIFWVFGTDVMLSVATGIDGPIKLVFPQAILSGDHSAKSLLGLGDMVIPGLFICQTLVFSRQVAKRGNFYFAVALLAYVASIANTMAVMVIYQHGQPALLFIVPWLLVTFVVAVLARGDAAVAWNFSVVEASPGGKNKSHKKKGKGKKSGTEEEEGEMGFVRGAAEAVLFLFGYDEETRKEQQKNKSKKAPQHKVKSQ